MIQGEIFLIVDGTFVCDRVAMYPLPLYTTAGQNPIEIEIPMSFDSGSWSVYSERILQRDELHRYFGKANEGMDE